MHLLAKLPFFIRKYIESLKLFYRTPKGYFQTSKQRNILSKSLVISFPRSGSSWVGSILGNTDNALYLREPVTTQYMLQKPGRISVFAPEKCEDLIKYQRSIKTSLHGITSRANAIFKYPQQLAAHNVHLIIKEVNPLALPLYFLDDVNVIYLLRHPFAIAQSYQSLSWQQQDQFTKRFDSETLAIIQQNIPNLFNENFWLQFGYLLGWIEAKTRALLTGKTLIIQYEEICQAPNRQFEKMFKHVNQPFTAKNKAHITRSVSGTTNVSKGQFSLERKLEDIATIKIKCSDKVNHDTLISAYLLAGQHYNDVFNTSITLSYDNNSTFIEWIDKN